MKSKSKTILTCGKGGVGKTTLTALLIDELLYAVPSTARVLVIDGDPDETLAFALNIRAPDKTIQDIRNMDWKAGTIRQSTLSAPALAAHRIKELGAVRQTILPAGSSGHLFDFMVMGKGDGAGCYCAANNALAAVFADMQFVYDYIVVDSPAGTEHLSRHRITRADLMLLVTTPAPITQKVGREIVATANRAGIEVGAVEQIVNFSSLSDGSSESGYHIPLDDGLIGLTSPTQLPYYHNARRAMQGLLKQHFNLEMEIVLDIQTS